MKKSGKVVIAVVYILIFLLLAGAVAVILRFTNGGTDDFKFFYVSNENNYIYATKDGATITSAVETQFNVKYTFSSENKGYTVKVVPNITDETKFVYSVDGLEYEYVEGLDLTPAFNVKSYDDHFIIKMPSSMQEALSALYEGQTVRIVEETDIKTHPYFILEITSFDEAAKIRITLRREPIYVENFELNDVVFW